MTDITETQQLTQQPAPQAEAHAPAEQMTPDSNSLPQNFVAYDPILQTISRAVFALVMLFALLLLWRGHHAPGGGFIAGLMTLCAFLLHRMATGRNVLTFRPTTLLTVGLAISFLTGLVPYLLGKPFLKSDYGYIITALTGEFEWATALVFDLGVYLVVVAAGSTITSALSTVEPQELVEEDR